MSTLFGIPLALIGLLFFFAFFVLTALWLYRPGAKETYASQASIPFNGEQS